MADYIEFLRGRHLLRRDLDCGCGGEMLLRPFNGSSDEERFKCRVCKNCKSIRTGSFFQGSKHRLDHWVSVMHYWSLDMQISDIAKLHNFSRKRVAQMVEYLRDVLSAQLLRTSTELGGPGITVNIDESVFPHEIKDSRGSNNKSQRWVFVMTDRSASPEIGHMEIVDTQDAERLMPIIQRHVRPGSVVYSKRWKSYTNISEQFNFVDHETVGCHAGAVESFWEDVKRGIKKSRGVLREHLGRYLEEQMWRKRYTGEVFDHLLAHIAEQYPVRNWNLL